MNTTLDKEEKDKIVQHVEKLAQVDGHPKWQHLRSFVLQNVKDKRRNTVLLLKSRCINHPPKFIRLLLVKQ